MLALGEHMRSVTSPDRLRCPPDRVLGNMQFCKVECDNGWHLLEKKFDDDNNKIKDYPRHPWCVRNEVLFNAECVKDADFTGLIIIISLLLLVLVAIPMVKLWMVRTRLVCIL